MKPISKYVSAILLFALHERFVLPEPGIGYEVDHIFTQAELWGAIPKAFIKQFLVKCGANPIIVEAGAYRGEDTVEMAEAWSDLGITIHAFEPLPHIHTALKQWCAPYGNIHTHPYALSDTNSYKTMYISSGRSDASSSLLRPKEHLENYPDVYFNHTLEVPTVTLDAWAEQNHIDRIDFLWLDLQGYESNMLKASPNILKTVKIILTEVQLCEAYSGCELYPSYKQWLDEQGFEIVRENFLGSVKEGNVLFVRKELLQS
jgi:FkbM family methyltransferase